VSRPRVDWPGLIADRHDARVATERLETGWAAACAAIVVAGVASRALHFATVDLPPALDDALGRILSLHFMVFMNQFGTIRHLLLLLVVVAAVFSVRSAFSRWRHGGAPPRAPGFALDPWLAAWLWLGYAVCNHAFDLSPDLLLLTVLTAPVLLAAAWPGARTGGRSPWLAVAAVGLAGLWWSAHPTAFHVLQGALWAAASAALVSIRGGFRRRRDWLAVAFGAAAALQVSSLAYGGLFPGALGDGGRPLGAGGAYDWCESPDGSRLYATHPTCRGQSFERCGDDYVSERALDDPTQERRLHFFDERFYGRMLHLLCLEDRVQVGMAETIIDSERYGTNVMEFSVDDPTRVTRDVLGKGDTGWSGAIFLHDRARHAVFYTSEFYNRIVRAGYGPGGDPPETMELAEARTYPPPHRVAGFRVSFEGSLVTSRDAVYPKRDSGFFGEWIRGTSVWELGLADRRVLREYRTNNGANNVMAVDAERDRLIVSGLWGLEVFDLVSGKLLRRVRTDLGPRLPVVDARHDLVYVPVTFGNHVLVLDRETFVLRGRLLVGAGGRNAHLTRDGRTLFAGGSKRAFFWDTEALAARLGPGASPGSG